MSWFLKALKKYATFQGRARRKEFWYFKLFNFIFVYLLIFIPMLFRGFGNINGLNVMTSSMWFMVGIYSFAIILPSLAVSIRRLHDTGRSGWCLLFSLIPLVGPFILLVFMFQDSQPGENQYGPNPKAITS